MAVFTQYQPLELHLQPAGKFLDSCNKRNKIFSANLKPILLEKNNSNNISRFDLVYERTNKSTDQITPKALILLL
jgi:hypothetical protein